MSNTSKGERTSPSLSQILAEDQLPVKSGYHAHKLAQKHALKDVEDEIFYWLEQTIKNGDPILSSYSEGKFWVFAEIWLFLKEKY